MAQGFFGRLLLVDLTRGLIEREEIPPGIIGEVLAGYGMGVRLLYERIPPGADPLGPENIVGLFPGLLTGSGVPFSGRFMVVGKSPLTGGWGESNCGGHFGPVLRSTGCDGLLISGRSPRPVYLAIDGDQAELRDAGHLWGLDSTEAEQRIRDEVGHGAQVLCIGPAGEKRSLIAALITDGGRAAARSGLAAVMGAKHLKAIAVRGQQRLPLHDPAELTRLSREYIRIFQGETRPLPRLLPRLTRLVLPLLRRLRLKPSGGPIETIVHIYRQYGTCFGTAFSTEMGDAPVRNWQGVAVRDFPLERSGQISDSAVIRHRIRRYACRHCPLACGGVVRLPGEGAEEARKPEYETLAAFGPLLLNDDLQSILQVNSLCNRYGLDTISTGAAVAFALECAEQGLLERELTDGLELSWGNGQAIVEVVRRIGRREGLGDLLADGVQRAAARLGGGAEALAMHVGGQELPMHDPRYEPLLGLAYVVDPTPGRHNPANSGIYDLPALRQVFATEDLPLPGRYDYGRKGALFALLNRYIQVSDSAGLCAFSLLMGRPPLREWINAATGWELSLPDLLRIGHRIQVLRLAFNLRQGLRPNDRSLPPRVAGQPPLPTGPLKGVTLDMAAMIADYRRAMGYDEATGMPTSELLASLGLSWLIED